MTKLTFHHYNPSGIHSLTPHSLEPWYSIAGFEYSILKSAAFSLQTSENNLKPPYNHFKRQIQG